MPSYAKYLMYGFNHKNNTECDGKQYEYTLSDNEPYIYSNHDFLDKVVIDKNITSITFYLKPGLSCKEYINKIHIELEQICFNLIVHSELPINCPVCCLELTTDEFGNEIQLEINERVALYDKLIMFKDISTQSLYNAAFNHVTNFNKHESIYKKIFWILHSPHKVIQFLGLYDLMATLIHDPISQKKVHDYFGKNKNKYPFIEFKKSRKDPKKMEDSLTYLRNEIAHSEQMDIKEYLNVSEKISHTHIQYLLKVINDIICDEEEDN